MGLVDLHRKEDARCPVVPSNLISFVPENVQVSFCPQMSRFVIVIVSLFASCHGNII
jgi:hypothetical protein